MDESKNVAGVTTRESVVRSMLETTNTHSTPGNRKAIFEKSYLRLTVHANGNTTRHGAAHNEFADLKMIFLACEFAV